MNFITEAFGSKETVSLDDLNNELPKLEKHFEVCKKEISSYLQNVEEELNEQPTRNHHHTSAIQTIKQNLKSIEVSLNNALNEDLVTAENDYKELNEELNEINNSISAVYVICEVHERLSMLKSFCENYVDYEKAVEVIDTLIVLIRTFGSAPTADFIEELKKMVAKEIESSNNILKKEFRSNCVLISEKNSIVLKVPENGEILSNLLPALFKNKFTREVLKTFSNFVYEKLFLTVIKYKSKVVLQNNNKFHVLRIDVEDQKINRKYDEVYRNLITIVEFLSKYVDCTIDDDLYLLKYIGSTIKSPLPKTILNESILSSIPNNWSQLEMFKNDLMKSTMDLKDNLKPLGLNDSQWEWINKIEEFYGENRCHYFENKAKEIMKLDLHEMVEVGKQYDPNKPLMETGELLRCSISRSILELLKLGEELINEILKGAVENRKILFLTYKGIFFNYGDFVAAHHQKLLESIPQQVALFNNNCKYLFRKLQEWDEEFETDPIFKDFYDSSAKAFHQVEEVGRLFFSSFVDDQKKQIESILKETNLQHQKTLEKLDVNTEKLLRQCLRQQELLKTVWSKVLSYPVYNETIGDILSSMCSFLINSLTSVEDLGAVVAEQLIEIFKIVLNRGPKLFTDSSEINLYVSNWYKFNELIFVLGASLLDINDRWADGKGPLALQFNPYELKQLIRALFQNSERRAAVLSKIHE